MITQPLRDRLNLTKRNSKRMKKMPSAAKVVWDESASLTTSLRSITEKTSLNDSKKSNERRWSESFSDFSSLNTSRVVRALSKFDQELDDIILGQPAASILAVNRDDLQKIKLLGKGQFCNVHSVAGSLEAASQQDENAKGSADVQEQARKRTVYALKSIDPKRCCDDDELIIAATDLAKEATILSELDHKNVIKLRGLSCDTFSSSFMDGMSSFGGKNASTRSLGFGGKSSSTKSLNRSLRRIGSLKLNKALDGTEGYFLLLDVLTEVLSDRLTRERSNKDSKSTVKRTKKSHKKAALYERIQHIVTGIVDGMKYLHSHDIVLRDLKPGNVGFDEEMNVRLFDFGMARRVSECNPNEICGSPRYMAPEIMQGEGYSLKVDVYSFGVLLYELCSLEVPFANSCALMKQKHYKKSSVLGSIFKKKPRASKKAKDISDDNSSSNDSASTCQKTNLLLEFYKRVVYDELRPSHNLEAIIPCPEIRNLIQDCWSADPDKRPSFEDIAPRLEAIFNSS